MFTPKTKDRFHADDFPITVERRNPQEHFELEAHDYYEIVIVVGGRAFHVTRRNSRPLGAGDILIVGGSEAHQYREIKELRLINILFRPDKLHMELLDLSGVPGYQALFSFEPSGRERDSQKSSLQLSSKELSVALNYVETLDHELKMRNPGFAFLACAWFMQLVGYLSRAYSQSRGPDPRARSSVNNAIGHLEKHFDQRVNLDELSRLTHMSKRSFIRAFQAATGTTPIAYLGNLRLVRAAAMLRRHEESVTSVAYKVGYNDSNYFARRFHAMFGFPPSQYRKRQELV
jgi:AraC-like DNA-binding protein/mannose-6-phosphate isomerase-like protein (cupin superfamily)